MEKFRERRFAVKCKGALLANTEARTRSEAKEKAIDLSARWTTERQDGLWKQKRITPTWDELRDDGYTLTKLVIKELYFF